MTDTCLCKLISDKEMEDIKAGLPSEAVIQNMGDFFKILGEPSRLKILYYLSRHELCVADLASVAHMQQSAVSHQLKLLWMSRLVKTRRDGTTIYYSLDDEHIHSIFALALQHLQEDK